MRLNKRGGHDLYFFIFGLIMIGLVAVAIINFKNRAENAETLDQRFLARDLALTMNTVYASPGSVVHTYKGAGLDKFKEFDYNFRENTVQISNGEKYSYATDSNFRQTNLRVQHPEQIVISNSGWHLTTEKGNVERESRYPRVEKASKELNGHRVLVESTAQRNGELVRAGTSTLDLFAGKGFSNANADFDFYFLVEFIPDEHIEVFIPPNTIKKSRELASRILNQLQSGLPASIHISEDEKLAEAKKGAVFIRLPENEGKPNVLRESVENS
jgi:hypothetical protein